MSDTNLDIDLLLQAMLAQLPIARFAQRQACQIHEFAPEAQLGALAIEAGRLIAETKRKNSCDCIESAAERLAQHSRAFITSVRSSIRRQETLATKTTDKPASQLRNSSLLVLEAFAALLEAIAAACVASC
jgi:hypothetical protein